MKKENEKRRSKTHSNKPIEKCAKLTAKLLTDNLLKAV